MTQAQKIIEKAKSRGWGFHQGTLQAKGLWNAFRNGARTNDDVTVWCESRVEAAEEALRFEKEVLIRKLRERALEAGYPKNELLKEAADYIEQMSQ